MITLCWCRCWWYLCNLTTFFILKYMIIRFMIYLIWNGWVMTAKDFNGGFRARAGFDINNIVSFEYQCVKSTDTTSFDVVISYSITCIFSYTNLAVYCKLTSCIPAGCTSTQFTRWYCAIFNLCVCYCIIFNLCACYCTSLNLPFLDCIER